MHGFEYQIANSQFDIRTVAVYHLIRVKNNLWHSESYRISSFKFQSYFLMHDFEYQITYSIDFQLCGMCDQQMLRPACTYAQSDQKLC